MLQNESLKIENFEGGNALSKIPILLRIKDVTRITGLTHSSIAYLQKKVSFLFQLSWEEKQLRSEVMNLKCGLKTESALHFKIL